MTSRELRTRRRAEERKTRKQERKQLAAKQPLATQPKEEAQPKDEINPLPKIGFVSQTPPEAAAARRAEINRQNAQSSTGPRTPEGKLASSRNAMKHGLTGHQIVVPGEDPTAYDSLLSALLTEHQPANTTEELLVTEMAQSHWLTQRAIRLQNDCFNDNGEVDAKRLALFLRYQTTHQRAFHKALNTLITLQKTRRKEQLGFVSQTWSSTASKNGFVSQNQPPEPEAGFVSQNPSEASLQEELSRPQAA